MERRTFLASCAGAAGLAGGIGSVAMGAIPAGKPFAKLPLKIAAPYGWFDGTPLERFEQAAAWGLPALEWLGPDKDPKVLKEASDKTGVKWSCILGVGAIAKDQMVLLEDHDRLEKQFRERIELAKKLGVTKLVGLSGETRGDITYDRHMVNVIKCLKRLAPIAEDNEVMIVMETLNQLRNHEGYWLTTTDQAAVIVEAVDSPSVKQLYDIYHQQITEGNLIPNITDNIDNIGHVHVGDTPGRKQPGSGEIHYSNVFKALAKTGYDGWVALECGYTDTAESALQDVLDCFSWA